MTRNAQNEFRNNTPEGSVVYQLALKGFCNRGLCCHDFMKVCVEGVQVTGVDTVSF